MKRMQRVFSDLDALRFVDNRLDEERRAAYLAHLADDPAQAQRVALWTRQNEAIRANFAALAAEPVPLWLRLGQVEQEKGSREGGVGERRRDPLRSIADERRPPRLAEVSAPPAIPVAVRRHRSASVGVSALVLLVIGALVVFAAHSLLPAPADTDGTVTRIGAPGPATAVGRAGEAFHTYALDAQRPVELTAADEPALDRWLQHRIGLPVRAPDLRAEGWTLLGGRLVPGEVGAAAFYVYENVAGERLGVAAGRSATAPSNALALDALPGGGAALSWTPGPLTMVMVSGKSLDWLSRHAESLRSAVARTEQP